jgi:TolB-like protein/Flp pilus assembly protein TadD
LDVGRQGTVFAYSAELDEWYRSRERRADIEGDTDSPPTGTRADIDGSSFAASPTDTPKKETSPPEPKPPVRFLKWLLGAAAAALSLGILFLLGTGLIPKLTLQPRSPVFAHSKIRLLVRPFANESGDPSDNAFAEGLTDEINTQLSRLDPDRLGVIAPTSSKQLANKPIPELRDQLKLQYVLEGSVFRGNNQVRVNAHLISADDETPVWSESYTDGFTDILKVQDTVASDVARKILVKLPSSNASKPRVEVDPDGYRAYLQGRKFWAIRDLPHSVAAFEAAIPKMPNYPPVHSGLASAYALLGQAPNDVSPATVTAPKARAEAQRALVLNPDSSEAHYVLGNLAVVYDWDFRAAEREFAEALRLEPNNPTAHQWWGQYLMARNRLPEAKSEIETALDLDPVSPIFTTALAEACYYARDFDGTISSAQLTLEQYPNFVLAEFWLGSAYREKRMYPEALTHFRKARALAPDNPALLMAYGHALGVSGDQAGAQRALADLQALSLHRYVPALYFAGMYIGLGRKNDALDAIQKALREHSDRLLYLDVEPIADPIRSDPRFRNILAQLHLR